MSCVLACDLGGSGLRAGLLDEGGRVLATAKVALAAQVAVGGQAEANPDDWWSALKQAADALAAAEPMAFAATEAIAITAFTRSEVLVGADGQAVRPAFLWRDTRAEATAKALRQRAADHPEAKALNAFHPLARLAWLGEHEPESLRRAACVLEPKDYLNSRLTGRAASDRVSMARLLSATTRHAGSRTLFDVSGVAASLMPAMLEPLEIVGRIEAGLPGALGRLAGKPVITVANDTWTAVVGLGAMRDGFAYNISGTTEVLGLVSAMKAEAAGLLTVDWGRGLTQLGGPSQCGGDTLRWVQDVLSSHEREGRPRNAQPLIFLPYLEGERVPHWDPALRGAFIGLSRQHGAHDLAAAALEGIAFLNRSVLEAAEAATGRVATEIRLGGGGARNRAFCDVKASVLGREVVVPEAEEPGLLGAAISAWTALGRFAGLAEAQAGLVKVSRRHVPNAGSKAGHDRLYALFRQAEQAIAPLSRALSEARSPSGTLP